MANWPKVSRLAEWRAPNLLLVEWPAGAELGPFEESPEGPVWMNRNFNVDLMKPREARNGSVAEAAKVNWGSSGPKNVEEVELFRSVLGAALGVAKGWDESGVKAEVPG